LDLKHPNVDIAVIILVQPVLTVLKVQPINIGFNLGVGIEKM